MTREEALNALRIHIGKDYLNNKQRKEIEYAHECLDIISKELQDPWQDISTAPRGGVKFLTTDGEFYELCEYRRQWGKDYLASSKSCAENGDSLFTEPTHWMPIPEFKGE